MEPGCSDRVDEEADPERVWLRPMEVRPRLRGAMLARLRSGRGSPGSRLETEGQTQHWTSEQGLGWKNTDCYRWRGIPLKLESRPGVSGFGWEHQQGGNTKGQNSGAVGDVVRVSSRSQGYRIKQSPKKNKKTKPNNKTHSRPTDPAEGSAD